MDIRKSKVEAAYVGGESSKRIGPGQLVDLDEVVHGALRVRDLFQEGWFEESSPAKAINSDVDGNVDTVK
jgi:hypothetical protein